MLIHQSIIVRLLTGDWLAMSHDQSMAALSVSNHSEENVALYHNSSPITKLKAQKLCCSDTKT